MQSVVANPCIIGKLLAFISKATCNAIVWFQTLLRTKYAHALITHALAEKKGLVQNYGVPFVSKRFFSVNLRYSCHDSLSWRRFSFRGDDSLFAATILFSRRRLSFRGDDSLFAATILFSWRLIDMGCRLCQNDFSPVYRAATCFSRRRTLNAATNKCDDFAATNHHDMRAPTNLFSRPAPVTMATISR